MECSMKFYKQFANCLSLSCASNTMQQYFKYINRAFFKKYYFIYSTKYQDRQVRAKSVDPGRQNFSKDESVQDL